MRRGAAAGAAAAGVLLCTASVALADPAAPGQSVVGQGKLAGAPELIVGTSGGNDVFAIGAQQSPVAYGGNVGGSNISNACLLDDDLGFADLGSGAPSTKQHQYSFSFPAGRSATAFSLTLLDWGDSMPFGTNADHFYAASLTAYNAANEVVDEDTVGFHSDSTTSTHRISTEFGDLATAGDACDAQAGQPGHAEFSVSGQGITRLTFAFRDRPSTDLNVALDRASYTLSEQLSALVQQPVNPDGSSTFNAKRGVVPLKFSLTRDGSPTCDLPPATLRLTRTGGTAPGPIDESVYSSSADRGSDFRIADCGYHYNVAASGLGAGTYLAEILIDGSPVGQARFEAK